MLGAGVDAVEARRSLQGALAAPELSALTDVAAGRVVGLWHLFQDVPFNVVALEALAKAFHPDLFADLDPARTMDEIKERFMAVPLPGTYVTSLR